MHLKRKHILLYMYFSYIGSHLGSGLNAAFNAARERLRGMLFFFFLSPLCSALAERRHFR